MELPGLCVSPHFPQGPTGPSPQIPVPVTIAPDFRPVDPSPGKGAEEAGRGGGSRPPCRSG